MFSQEELFAATCAYNLDLNPKILAKHLNQLNSEQNPEDDYKISTRINFTRDPSKIK